MSNTHIKAKGPEGVKSASAEGANYTIGEDGFFRMPLEHLQTLASHGFSMVMEKHPADPALDPAVPATGGETSPSSESSKPAITEGDEGNASPAPAPATSETPAADATENGPSPAPAAGETTQPSSSEAPGADDTMLLGSSVQPSTFTLAGGDIMQLGTVVAEAQKRLGCTAKEWNELADADRESFIQSVVDELPLAQAGEVADATANLENEGGKPAPEAPEETGGGDGASAPAPETTA